MMKKTVVILAGFLCCMMAYGQLGVKAEFDEASINKMRNEFQELLKQKDLLKTMEKGADLSRALTSNKQYKEAHVVCGEMEMLIYRNKLSGKDSYNYHFFVTKERLRLYTQQKEAKKAKEQFDQMNYFMLFLPDDSQTDDILLTKAEYYHTFGMETKSLEAYEMLLQRCLDNKAEQNKESCYKEMIAYATQEKNSSLDGFMKKKFTAWQDSIQMVNAVKELQVLKSEHETLQTDLQNKEKTISNNKIFIVGLWAFIVALIAVLVILFFLFLRNIYRVRKLKQSLRMVNDSNAQKATFINNISSQINPGLEEVEHALVSSAGTEMVQEELDALKKNIVDMQTYISLEETRDEPYEVKVVEISQFCEAVMDKSKPLFKTGVESNVNAPRISIKTNMEALEHILAYLLKRAAVNTDSGKISLEFKKRNARTGQFIITDTGMYIDPEIQNELFKPFGDTGSLTVKGDSWGLPICSLMAYKLNGTLKIDAEYKKGTRFVLDLCS